MVPQVQIEVEIWVLVVVVVLGLLQVAVQVPGFLSPHLCLLDSPDTSTVVKVINSSGNFYFGICLCKRN